jgi:hypothetical protein
MQLVMAAGKGDGAAVARLLAAGADPNALVPGQMPSGEVFQTTALHAAAVHGRPEAVRLLLDAGADPSLANGDGATPLIQAAGTGHPEVVRLLLARGAAVDAVDPGNGFAAFHYACFENQAECAEALVRAGCDVGLKDNDGHTGQQLAEAQGSKEAARRLRALARQPFVGVLVELAGLIGAAEHNGKRATVMSIRPSRSHHASVFLARVRILSALCTSIEERYAMRGSRKAVELTPPFLRCQVLRYLPEKQRYTLELLEPPAGGGGAGKRMDVRPANFVLAHLPAGTRCASWQSWLPPRQSGVLHTSA